jgi:plasmid stabilization system protein ParE
MEVDSSLRWQVGDLSHLEELTLCTGQFGPEAAQRTTALLQQLLRTEVREPAELIRLHEIVLFLRAFPQDATVARLCDEVLHSFADRMADQEEAAAAGLFDDPEVSGIAGTVVSTNFSHQFARSLAARHGSAISIDWENFPRPDRLGSILGRLIPMAYEEYAVEPHVDWRAWLEKESRGSVDWLTRRVDALTYDLLEIPLRWDLRDSAASRSTLRLPRARRFYHSGPFLKRNDVSIEAELGATPPIPVRRLAASEAAAVLGVIVDASAARYRELYGFEHPDHKHVYHADFGRGVDVYVFGVPPADRLPLRACHSAMFFKNGVPMGYVEALSLFERCEVGFNLYYTFREGETAWLYARILKLLHQQLGVTCFSVDPYQLGHENEEAIASGAFWFYYKLGFRPAAQVIASLAERESAKAATKPGYRTPPATLRRLAAGHLFFGDRCGDWAGFSMHRLGAKTPNLGEDIARAKHAPEEIRYLHLLNRRQDLRGRVLYRGRTDR